MAEPTERRRLTFDPTINAGHIISLLAFLITLVMGWSTLDKRIVVLEEARKAQSQLDQYQDATQRASNDAVHESLKEIKDGIRELNARFDRKEGRQ